MTGAVVAVACLAAGAVLVLAVVVLVLARRLAELRRQVRPDRAYVAGFTDGMRAGIESQSGIESALQEHAAELDSIQSVMARACTQAGFESQSPSCHLSLVRPAGDSNPAS